MKLFSVKLKCPFCQEEFDYNIISFKAKHECKNCHNDCIVRTKQAPSGIISLPGFFIILSLREMLGISKMHVLVNLIYVIFTCILYIGVAYKIATKIKTPSYLYQVDAQDPTELKRYKGKKNKK